MHKMLLSVLMLVAVLSSYAAETNLPEMSSGLRSGDSTSQVDAIGDSLQDISLTKKLNNLERLMHQNERKAGQWWTTWTVLYGVATVGQGVAAVVGNDRSTRQDMILGAGTTTLGVLSQLLTPVSTGFRAIGPDSMAHLSTSAKQKLLEEDEALLQKQMDIAFAGKSWQTHALSGAVNLASGLITWIGFKRSFGEGLLNFALNTVVTEAQIWSQPVWARKYYRKVLWDLHEESFRPNTYRIPEWYGLAGPCGIGLGLRF